MNVGNIVRCRNRDWVLMPSDNDAVLLLRPLTGAIDETIAIHKGLSELLANDIPSERIEEARFPLPSPEDFSDTISSQLLLQASRLILREGATPFRSLGRISIRPRTYQFVPLLMALRLDPIRMLVADDVGVGKTVEALLIARELWDRHEIRNVCVLCPPYLCEQWQKELTEKFNLEAVVIRSGTVSQLERNKPHTKTIYEHYPIQVVSIDYIKSERNSTTFLVHCPDFLIIDEAHGATSSGTQSQQRHELLKKISKLESKPHMIMLTATPHSGVQHAFSSLLALLDPVFGEWEVATLEEAKRKILAMHFVQRTRKDIEHGWEAESCFPERVEDDKDYRLSDKYLELFQKTYNFCQEIVSTGQQLEKRKQRGRYWGALALLRCVMSSPAAAKEALRTRQERLSDSEEEIDSSGSIYESSDDHTDDESPTALIEVAECSLDEKEKRRLRDFKKLAEEIEGSEKDTKLKGCADLVKELLQEGYSPIIWCRYIHTAEYVREHLEKQFNSAKQKTSVVCVTGRIPDEDRKKIIEDINTDNPRILVATDCVSEGVNLQEKFNAAIHYDLPWNPNRLEQREGRVDRFGQKSPKVKTFRYYSPDNQVDGVVLRVLLDKAREIRKTLGTSVPVPKDSESVTQAVLNALFLGKFRAGDKSFVQQPLAFENYIVVPDVVSLHQQWAQDCEREKVSRTRFAQHAIKPDEVQKELEAADSILGKPEDVREFVLSACQRIGISIENDPKDHSIFKVNVSLEALVSVPEAVKSSIRIVKSGKWKISFISPTPEGCEYIGRNHRFVSALARYLLEDSLTQHGQAQATRCGVMRTADVSKITTLLLLRVRHLIEIPQKPAMLAEEVKLLGYRGLSGEAPHWIADSEALRLLAEVKASGNIPDPEKKELIRAALDEWSFAEKAVLPIVKTRAQELEAAHKRIRKSIKLRILELKVRPQLPPDLLGILVLQPVAEAK